jgi:hypothetical protein
MYWDCDGWSINYCNWEAGVPITVATVDKSDVLAYFSCGKPPARGTILAKAEHVTIVKYSGP